MPSVTFEDTLTGAGSSILGGTRVFYVAWEVTVQGSRVRNPRDADPDILNGVGSVSLGNDLTSLGLITGIGYSEPIWLNAVIGQWIAPPGQVGSDFSSAIAQYIRWSLSLGTEVHLYVFGDT